MAPVLKLSEHFTLDELTASQEAARRGLDNTPTAEQIGNLRGLCVYILEPLRLSYNRPVVVSSGFRSAAVNKLIGGAKKSDHLVGLAADFTVPGISTEDVCQRLMVLGLPCKQVINEFGRWVHVSLSKDPSRPAELLTAARVNGVVTYSKGLA